MKGLVLAAQSSSRLDIGYNLIIQTSDLKNFCY